VTAKSPNGFSEADQDFADSSFLVVQEKWRGKRGNNRFDVPRSQALHFNKCDEEIIVNKQQLDFP
jgi:hypothetical protein